MIHDLLAKGKYARAAQQLTQQEVMLSPEEQLEQLQAVHPQEEEHDMDLPEVFDNDNPPFERKGFLKAIRSANSSASPGPDGMTMSMLQDIVSSCPKIAYEVAVRFASGKLAPIVYEIFGTSRLCAIPKSNATTVRPIAIAPAFVRAVGRALLQHNQEDITDFCGRVQFGTGAKAAAEMMVHGMTSILQRNTNFVVTLQMHSILSIVRRC